MAVYPGGIRTWTTKRDFNQDILESHMNDLQDENVAGQKVFGVNPQIATNDPGGIRRDYSTVDNRLTRMVLGEHIPYYQGSVLGYLLHPTSQENNPQVPDKDPDGHDLEWCGGGRRQRGKKIRLSTGETVWSPYHWEVPDRDNLGVPWLGLPLEQDEQTIGDGNWQRLPIIGQDDPLGLGIGDGLILNETGLWMINLKVDGYPTEDTTLVKARRRARLEINGRDATLRHMVRENQYNGDFLINTVTWVEVLKKGTIITASARIDGVELVNSVPINAYLRAHLIRCTSEEDDGMLRDFPESIYTPPPPPPPKAPSVPRTPSSPSAPREEYSLPPLQYMEAGYNLSGPYAVEIRPGEWYGYYGWGTVGPQDSPIFPGIGLTGNVYG